MCFVMQIIKQFAHGLHNAARSKRTYSQFSPAKELAKLRQGWMCFSLPLTTALQELSSVFGPGSLNFAAVSTGRGNWHYGP